MWFTANQLSMTQRLLIVLLPVILCLGCQRDKIKPITYFDTAESAYRAGQYEVAHSNYTMFLKQNPDPQLARLAERRIHGIERELECILGQKSGPRPAYVNATHESGTPPSKTSKILYKTDHSMKLPVYE